jgi:hypothetical protein
MFIQHIALVPEAAGIDPSELARVSAALQKQVTRDFAPAWGVHATVDAFPRLEDVPVGYWPILVTRDIGSDSGVRIDRDGTPYAQVEYSTEWSIDASRACLEMLVNPFGKRTVSAPSPRSDQGRVEVVLEVCAPCADVLCAYAINDVVVSDFCLPAFYEEGPTSSGKRLSLNGSLGAPFRVLPGGHLTWFDVVSESYWRRSHWTENPIDTRLGKLALAASQTLPARLRSTSPAHEAFQARVELDRQHTRRVSEVRAMRLRASFLSSGLSEPPPALPRQTAREQQMREEPITVVEITEEPAPRASAMPPPLPRASKQPAATAPVMSSTAPVSILREPDRAPKATPAIIAAGVLAAAAALGLVWRANNAPQRATAPATVTTMEAATAAAPPPAPAPSPPAAPIEAPVPAAAEPAAERPKEQTVAAAPAPAIEKAKRTKRRVEADVEPAAPVAALPTPPAPAQPEPVAAAPKPAVAQAPAKTEPSSIDDLIDTRR